MWLVSMNSSELFSSFHDLEMDRNTTLYDPKNNQILPLLKAISSQDQSFIKWCYLEYLNLNLVSQNFPRVLSYATLLNCNDPFYSNYCSFQVISISNLSIFCSSVPSFFDYNEDIVELFSMILEQSFTHVWFEEVYSNSPFVKSQHSANDDQNTIFPVVESQHSIGCINSPILPSVEFPYSTNDSIKINPLTIESQHTMIDEHNTPSQTQSLIQIHSSFPIPSPNQESKPIVLSDIPSSSQNKFVDVSQDIDQQLKENSEELHEKISSVVRHLPENDPMRSVVQDISQHLHARDQIFLKIIKEQKKTIQDLQQKNENSIKSLSNKVLELGSTFKNGPKM